MTKLQQIFLGEQLLRKKESEIKEYYVEDGQDQFYVIENYKNLPPFFMTITSNTNHWMFISSTGGLTAGRVNSESAIFPYYTDDKITENHRNTGPRTVLLVTGEDKTYLWEPFDDDKNQVYETRSVLSKNVTGNIVVFEEINETLGVSFSYRWMNSMKYGWIRKASLKNLNQKDISIEIVDGFQNIIPAGTTSKIQNTFGNLLNAYKKSEIDSDSGMGIFALSATLTDLAEPSESLKANVVWQRGLSVDNYLLSPCQLEQFSIGEKIKGEFENKGERGCYFIHSSLTLGAESHKEWYFAADVDKDHKQINNLKDLLLSKVDVLSLVEEDVQKGHQELTAILSPKTLTCSDPSYSFLPKVPCA